MNARTTSSPFPLKGGPLSPVVGIAGLLLMLATLCREEWIAICCIAPAVGAVYAATAWLRRR